MNSRTIEDIEKTSKDISASLATLYAIGNNTLKQIADQQIAFFGLYTECVIGQLRLFRTPQNYREFLTGESDLIDNAIKKAQGITRNMIDIAHESKDETHIWLSENTCY